MINYLDKVYSSLRRLNKFESLVRFSIRRLSNILIPIYLKKTKSKIELVAIDGEKIIVSLTTFPQRISKLWIVIECMLRQSLKPNKIVLWLSSEQFPYGIKGLPKSLTDYYHRNQLEIYFVAEDLRSHKKYYYALDKYPNDIIITVDDDIFYPSNIIQDLLALHRQYPDSICCHRAHEVIKKDNGQLTTYLSWKKVYDKRKPSFNLFHTSGGGTLYKRNFFSNEVLNKNVFKELCFSADDIWLNIMAQINKTQTVKSMYFSNLIPIEYKKNIFKLSSENVNNGANDIQLKNLIKKYNLNEYELFN